MNQVYFLGIRFSSPTAEISPFLADGTFREREESKSDERKRIATEHWETETKPLDVSPCIF